MIHLASSELLRMRACALSSHAHDSVLRVNWILAKTTRLKAASSCKAGCRPSQPSVMDSLLFGDQDEESTVPESVLRNLLVEVCVLYGPSTAPFDLDIHNY